MNVIIPAIFMIITAVYFLTNWLNDRKPSQENTLVGVFGVQLVSFCLIFANLNGFLSIYEIFNSISYMILMYAGTTKTMAVLYKNDQKVQAKKIYYQFVFWTWFYMLIDLAFVFFVEKTGSNRPMQTVFVACPVYTHIIFFVNLKCVHDNKLYRNEKGKFEWVLFLTSFITVSWLISLYEWVDLWILLQNINKMDKAFTWYADPTLQYDIIWLIVCVVFLLFVPRLWASIKYKNK